MGTHKSSQQVYSPANFGVNGVACDAAKTSNWINVSGANQLSLDLALTNVAGGAGAALTFNLQYADDQAGTNAYTLQAGSTATGTTTLVDRLWSHAHGGADANFHVDIPVNGQWVRVSGLVTDDAAADTCSITATVAFL